MRKRVSGFTVLGCGILLLFCLLAWKGIALHNRYPDPQIRIFRYGESIQIGGYEMLFDGWEWGDESLIKERFPDFILVYAGEDSLPEEARAGLIRITVTKIFQGEEILDLTSMGFSSGAWGNQFDLELFYLLNPKLDAPFLDLAAGETQDVVLPMTMLESQFTGAQWEEIDSREFYVNLQYYPEHIRFLCPCGS